MTATTVGVAIPSIPPRTEMLDRALRSVVRQTRTPNQISVAIDHVGEGASATRNRALDALDTEWVAFLDDDDEFLPQHLEKLVDCAEARGADLVYPWFEGINTTFWSVPNEAEELVSPEGLPWTPHLEEAFRTRTGNFIPMTVLVRTDLVRKVGGFIDAASEGATGEDYHLWIRLLDAGAKFAHLPRRTWRWNGHRRHYSGRDWRNYKGHASAEWVRNEQAAGRDPWK